MNCQLEQCGDCCHGISSCIRGLLRKQWKGLFQKMPGLEILWERPKVSKEEHAYIHTYINKYIQTYMHTAERREKQCRAVMRKGSSVIPSQEGTLLAGREKV